MRSWCLKEGWRGFSRRTGIHFAGNRAGRSRRAGGERGVAIIEFSIVSGLMVLLLLGIMAYGEILANYVQLKYAVGELSRQVATGTSTADRQSRYTAAEIQVRSRFTGTCADFTVSGYTGTVTVTGNYHTTAAGCRRMPSFFLPMPTLLVATNEFTVQ